MTWALTGMGGNPQPVILVYREEGGMSDPVSDVEFYARSLDQHNTPWADGCARVMRAAEARATAAEEQAHTWEKRTRMFQTALAVERIAFADLTGEIAQVREKTLNEVDAILDGVEFDFQAHRKLHALRTGPR